VRAIVVLFSLLLCVDFVSAQTDPDVLNYSLPEGAVRGPVGNSSRRGYNNQNIFPPGTDLTRPLTVGRPELIGYEEFFHGRLTERILFRKELRFGVTRKWHTNGQLATEEPYRDDVMDGLFRQWDEQGRLVAQYILREGDGTKQIYNSSGELICENHLVKGNLSGWCTGYNKMFESRYLGFFVNNNPIGIALSFDRDWHVTMVSWHSKDLPASMIHGPQIHFKPDGTLAYAKWYLNGKKVTEAEYAKEAAKDSSLPPYYVDTTKYREINDSEARTMMLHYKNLPRVKIPLEFDANGNPLPAEPQPAPTK